MTADMPAAAKREQIPIDRDFTDRSRNMDLGAKSVTSGTAIASKKATSESLH
jgi:hypothetical protein